MDPRTIEEMIFWLVPQEDRMSWLSTLNDIQDRPETVTVPNH